MTAIVVTTVFITSVSVGALTDIRSRRIPNALTVGGLTLALVLRGAMGGHIFVDGILGVALALAILLPLFAMRGVGGGDVKMLIMVGAFLGPKGFFVALLATAVVGGAMSVFAAVRSGVILPVLFNTGSLLKWVLTLGTRGERTTLDSQGTVSVPYGVAIALGSVVALYMGGGI